MSEDQTDETLMLAYRDGDNGAFECLFERHRDPLFRYIVRHVGNASFAEELFQDIWMNIVRTRERYEVRAKFTTMLYHMASHRVIDHYRTSGTRNQVLADCESDDIETFTTEAPTQARILDGEREVARLQELISTLPPEQRDVFLLYEEAGLSLDQIATITGVARETTKSRLRYAVAKLRTGLGGDQ
ncbi:MAG: sigma-70 family RNA polymerase sigma factor [Gammaproteobacteria bacterium]|nr:sigma-70 family RNA polymerase sigma factor [Gammaproteobacteria bacterium]